jgi:hypothetical protein
MNNKNLIRTFLLLSALVACGVARAKTVALWPLEVDSNNIGLRCVVNPSNDLNKIDSNFVSTDTGVEWELPPNPDTDRHALVPLNRSAVHEKWGTTQNGFLNNTYTARHLRRDKAFTIEGWIKVLDLPASNTWACILSAYGLHAPNGADNNRWTFSLRRRSNENYACSWILWGNGSQDTVLYRYADEEASYAITNTWIHIALTHEPLGANRKDHWTLFLNGVQAGESDNAGSVVDTYTNHRFDLGARSDGNQINAVFDYWRISDKVLEPSEFLCAGGGGTAAPTNSTVAYWPLGVTETGGIDCRDAVGDAPLTGGFYGTVFHENCMTPIEDCAFAGNPPNTTVTLSEGNVGSFLGCATSACLRQETVGACLNVTSNFTVEGWFCPRIYERATKTLGGEACCYLFGTRLDYGKGWALQYRAKGIDKFQFDLYCVDGATSTLINNVKLSGSFDMNSWYDTWRHVALSYNAAGGANGNGLWTLYIDGVQTGSAANSRAPTAITDFRPFILGGRAAIANHSFQGKVDCVRVSATVLSPNQFLNATSNPAVATDVVGFWPLNVINGVFPDLRDVSGKSNHFASLDNYPISLVTPDPDNQPTISNPDRTPTFRGDPSKVKGSTRFRDPDASTDIHKANLITGSKALMTSLAAGDFTYEFYYLRRSSNKVGSNDQEVFFMPAGSNNGAYIRFFRKKEGFFIWETLYVSSTLADTCVLSGTDSDLKYDQWQHIALVHTIEPVDGVAKSVWRLYLDGVLKGTASQNAKTGSFSTPTRLFVGGRHVRDKNSVIGNLSSVRLSNRALDPSEFLCATPAAGEKPEPTAGYWPIDSTAPGLANLGDEEYPLEASGTATAQAESARLSIPNKNALTNVVTGAARQNHGSYALGAGGTLAAASIGYDMAGPKPFTVEGWLKWTPAAGTADEDLITVGDALTGNGGLRIYFDKTGETPKLRVFARGAWPCTPYVDGAFEADLTPLVGTWAHVAIAYDISDGEGTWTLYIEGKQVGQVKNFYHPTPVDYSRGGDFTIGSAAHPLSAAVDMWRVSTIAYTPDDLLFAPLGGTIMIFR